MSQNDITVGVTIDNKPFRVEKGITILKAAEQNDIYIPTLCAHADLPASRRLPHVHRGSGRDAQSAHGLHDPDRRGHDHQNPHRPVAGNENGNLCSCS